MNYLHFKSIEQKNKAIEKLEEEGVRFDRHGESEKDAYIAFDEYSEFEGAHRLCPEAEHKNEKDLRKLFSVGQSYSDKLVTFVAGLIGNYKEVGEPNSVGCSFLYWDTERFTCSFVLDGVASWRCIY